MLGKSLQGNLSKEEKIIAIAKFSKSKLIVSWIIFGLFIIGCLIVHEIGFKIWAVVFFLLSLVFTYKFLFNKLAVTNKRVIGKICDLTVKTMDAPLNKIQTVTVEKGILDGLFKCGKIRINTASGQFVFHSVCDPFGFKNTVMEWLDLYEKKE